MREIKRLNIDWRKTGENLKLLRLDNLNLRRYVCWAHRKTHGRCLPPSDCEECSALDMDSQISRRELAEAMNVSLNTLVNWESGRSVPALEDLLLYCSMCGVSLTDLLILQD